ncbi:hypothetical protein ACHAWF_009311 [Thalassiosira exigua]
MNLYLCITENLAHPPALVTAGLRAARPLPVDEAQGAPRDDVVVAPLPTAPLPGVPSAIPPGLFGLLGAPLATARPSRQLRRAVAEAVPPVRRVLGAPVERALSLPVLPPVTTAEAVRERVPVAILEGAGPSLREVLLAESPLDGGSFAPLDVPAGLPRRVEGAESPPPGLFPAPVAAAQGPDIFLRSPAAGSLPLGAAIGFLGAHPSARQIGAGYLPPCFLQLPTIPSDKATPRHPSAEHSGLDARCSSHSPCLDAAAPHPSRLHGVVASHGTHRSVGPPSAKCLAQTPSFRTTLAQPSAAHRARISSCIWHKVPRTAKRRHVSFAHRRFSARAPCATHSPSVLFFAGSSHPFAAHFAGDAGSDLLPFLLPGTVDSLGVGPLPLLLLLLLILLLLLLLGLVFRDPVPPHDPAPRLVLRAGVVGFELGHGADFALPRLAVVVVVVVRGGPTVAAVVVVVDLVAIFSIAIVDDVVREGSR